MWRSIRIRRRDLPYDDYDEEDMVKIYCNVVEQSCHQLEDIDIEGFNNDDILKCIANNGSHLRSMRFVDCYEISDEGFSELARNLTLLEKFDISDTKLTAVSIAVLGRSRPLLKSLKFSRLEFNSQPCDDLALVIADTMTNLWHLDIKGDNLTNVGLLAILDKCPFLKSLDIRRCYYLELSEGLEKRCIDLINHLQLPNPDDSDDYDYYPNEYDFDGHDYPVDYEYYPDEYDFEGHWFFWML